MALLVCLSLAVCPMCHAVLPVSNMRSIEAAAVSSGASASTTAMIDDYMLDVIGTLVR